MSLIRSEIADGVLTVELHEPDRRNPLSAEMRAEIESLLDPLPAQVRAVVFTGAGGVFSAGGDLASMPPESQEATDARMARVADFIRLIASLRVPTIAAVERACAGASVGFACACDVIVAGRSAKFLLPFANLGIVPDGGLLSLLPQRVGASRAKRLLLEAAVVSAEDGERWGLVDELIDDGAALERAHAAAARLAAKAPGTVRAIRSAFAQGVPDLEDALAAEAAGQRELFFTEDFIEGRDAFFEKRRPRFTGR